MKSKLKILIPVMLLLFGGVYKFALAKPAAPAPKPKVEGEVYVIPKEFYVNLEGGHFAKLGVALVFHHGFTAAAAAGGHGAPVEPPEGYGALTQEAIVRSIITDTLTDRSTEELQSKKGRHELQEKILHRIEKETDVKAEHVMFTDVAVQ